MLKKVDAKIIRNKFWRSFFKKQLNLVSYLSAKKAGYRKCALVLTPKDKKCVNLKSHEKSRDKRSLSFVLYFVDNCNINRNINTLGEDHETKESDETCLPVYFFTEMCQFNESNSCSLSFFF